MRAFARRDDQRRLAGERRGPRADVRAVGLDQQEPIVQDRGGDGAPVVLGRRAGAVDQRGASPTDGPPRRPPSGGAGAAVVVVADEQERREGAGKRPGLPRRAPVREESKPDRAVVQGAEQLNLGVLPSLG